MLELYCLEVSIGLRILAWSTFNLFNYYGQITIIPADFSLIAVLLLRDAPAQYSAHHPLGQVICEPPFSIYRMKS